LNKWGKSSTKGAGGGIERHGGDIADGRIKNGLFISGRAAISPREKGLPSEGKVESQPGGKRVEKRKKRMAQEGTPFRSRRGSVLIRGCTSSLEKSLNAKGGTLTLQGGGGRKPRKDSKRPKTFILKEGGSSRLGTKSPENALPGDCRKREFSSRRAMPGGEKMM